VYWLEMEVKRLSWYPRQGNTPDSVGAPPLACRAKCNIYVTNTISPDYLLIISNKCRWVAIDYEHKEMSLSK
jgi:hypothetical protein